MPKKFRRKVARPLKKFVKKAVPPPTSTFLLQYRSSFAAKMSAWYDMREIVTEDLIEFESYEDAARSAERLIDGGTKLVFRIIEIKLELKP